MIRKLENDGAGSDGVAILGPFQDGDFLRELVIQMDEDSVVNKAYTTNIFGHSMRPGTADVSGGVSLTRGPFSLPVIDVEAVGNQSKASATMYLNHRVGPSSRYIAVACQTADTSLLQGFVSINAVKKTDQTF